MKAITLALVTAAAMLATPAFATHKAGHTANNPEAPGQNRACVVTTSGGLQGTVISGEWMPRHVAEKKADNQTTFVGDHPGVQTREGCEGLPGSIQ